MPEIVYKAKKPFKQDGKHYYPITTHDQIIMPDGTRWNGNNKHDTEVNWLKAINFIPMAGEIIVYDPDDTHSYAREKIGDGTRNVIDLPFVADALTSDRVDKQISAALVENQADWADGDSTSPSYIKNRPFYDEKVIGEAILSDYSFTIPEGETQYSADGKLFTMTDGEYYAISVNGNIEYASSGADCGGKQTSIYNWDWEKFSTSSYNVQYNNMYHFNNSNLSEIITTFSMGASGDFTVSIYKYTITPKQLDSKYLPGNLPAPLPSDVDKFVQVNDSGAYVLSDIDALPVDGTAADSEKLGGVAADLYMLKADAITTVNNTKPDENGNVRISTLISDPREDGTDQELSSVPINADQLGGKAPEYYIQPRNLLDNSDFTNPVNERGATSYAGTVYGIDRWRSWLEENNVIVSTALGGYVYIEGAHFVQYITHDKIKSGKTYTFAVSTLYGDIKLITATCPMDEPKIENGLSIQLVDGDNSFVCITTTGNYVWAALYEGEYTAETLPPYVPKGYAVELLECQRYYKPQLSYNLYCYTNGYLLGDKFAYPMRTTPTPVIGTVYTASWGEITGTTQIVVDNRGIALVENANFVAGSYYRVYASFSADL